MPHPAPDLWDVLEEVRDGLPGSVIGDIHQAASAAGVKPGTIRTWMTRGKIRPLFGAPGAEVFHIPTAQSIAARGAQHTPRDPAANSRGPHQRRRPTRQTPALDNASAGRAS
ncbi:hypothetical protein [Streptomyces sp. NPDC047315]|uniref:hypothetical protein n=1 Tax=Streptomyces sp. NPDC047315 TaxID=3155142 RepID=UPI0033FA7C81